MGGRKGGQLAGKARGASAQCGSPSGASDFSRCFAIVSFTNLMSAAGSDGEPTGRGAGWLDMVCGWLVCGGKATERANDDCTVNRWLAVEGERDSSVSIE